MKTQTQKIVLLSLACLGTSLSSLAKISLPAMFTDNMVLQQQTDAPIWGKASAQKEVKITTSWDQKSYTVNSGADGQWKISLKTPIASLNPYTISISDGQALVLKNVLIGEVWVCSGQSNMEMPLAGWGKANNYEQEIKNANFKNIRLLQVKKTTSNQPTEDLLLNNDGWMECTPATIPEFSAVGYFFGRNLYQSLSIPIGLINTSWGGTIVEAWTSGESAATMPDFKQSVENIKSGTTQNEKQQYVKNFAEWEKIVLTLDGGFQNEKPTWAETDFNDQSWKTMDVPGYWEKKGLSGFDGIVWFRKTIQIPKKWAGKNLTLNLGSIDDIETTYFNGQKIGYTDSWEKQRVYPIPAKFVKNGQAVITVRVYDTGGDGGFCSDASKLFLSLSKDQNLTLAGDWKYSIGVALAKMPVMPLPTAINPNRPTVLFNGMINPLLPFSIRGVIWYQGESNAERAYQYRDLFPLMINDWRKKWNADLPFYFVQLANYMAINKNPGESKWAELREAQTRTLHLENTGMAVSIDIGNTSDIHPKNKQEVGLRLALAARAKTYGEKIAFSGPLFDSFKMEGSKIRISFKHTDQGLKAKEGELKGFAIAGVERVFHWAQAKIEGSEVVVSCPEVDFPVAVRYAWADNPVCNLYNGAGLPASPFRTDDWPGLTLGKK